MVDLREEIQRVFDVHSQDFGNVFSSPFDGEDFRLISFAVAEFAWNVRVRQKLQFYFLIPIAIAGRAGSFIGVEAEIA